VKVILLDNRWSQNKTSGDMLGEEQWEWLERELRTSDAQIHLIGAGLQIIQKKVIAEGWSKLPKSRSRLFQLIHQTKAPGVILLSGDVHYAEIVVADEDRDPEFPRGLYPIFDFTSSALTHSWASLFPHYVTRFINLILLVNRHDGFIVRNDKGKDLFYAMLNYGLITINWTPPITITLSLVGLDESSDALPRRDIWNYSIPLSILQFKNEKNIIPFSPPIHRAFRILELLSYVTLPIALPFCVCYYGVRRWGKRKRD